MLAAPMPSLAASATSETPLPRWWLGHAVRKPVEAFEKLAGAQPDPHAVFFKYAVPLALIPPAFAFVGTTIFGWRLGAKSPLYLAADERVLAVVCYYFVLLGGLVGTAAVSRWMAPTYNARGGFGLHLALVCAIAAPFAVGSVCHLFPHVFVNMLALIPVLIWSLYLLYRGLPIVLGTGPERGMLMASSLVAWLLVGIVSLLGLTVGLWAAGIGPAIGV